AVGNRQLVLLTGAVVGDRQGVGHRCSAVSVGFGVGCRGGHRITGDAVTAVGPSGQVLVPASLAAERLVPLVHGTGVAQDAQQSIAHPTYFMPVRRVTVTSG